MLTHDDAVEIRGHQNTISLYEIASRHETPLITIHPKARMDWTLNVQAVRIHKDSITDIRSAVILSLGDQPLTIVFEGSSDSRNTESYIYRHGQDSVVCLPTNGGLLGISDEEGALIMQSYDYYKDGGRYSIIEAFDYDGNRLGRMPVKMHPEYDSTLNNF